VTWADRARRADRAPEEASGPEVVAALYRAQHRCGGGNGGGAAGGAEEEAEEAEEEE
jgi:hypothetical protein